MQVGDEVSWYPQPEEHVDVEAKEDVLLIGWVTKVEGDKAEVTEAHAFHRLWGGSSAMRFTKHEVPLDRLQSCPASYRHIIRMYRDRDEVK